MAQSRISLLRGTPAAAAPCSVCGAAEVTVDMVQERGLWRLSECRRCENRWTEGPFGGPNRPARALAVVPPGDHEAEAA